MAYVPHRGDIVWLNLDPRIGHEQSGRRPCLVLSSNLYTQQTGWAVICPVTSRAKGLPFEVRLKQTKTKGAILPIHVRSIDTNARQSKYIEKAPPAILNQTLVEVATIVNLV